MLALLALAPFFALPFVSNDEQMSGYGFDPDASGAEEPAAHEAAYELQDIGDALGVSVHDIDVETGWDRVKQRPYGKVTITTVHPMAVLQNLGGKAFRMAASYGVPVSIMSPSKTAPRDITFVFGSGDTPTPAAATVPPSP